LFALNGHAFILSNKRLGKEEDAAFGGYLKTLQKDARLRRRPLQMREKQEGGLKPPLQKHATLAFGFL
jgi:hypothetical protein